MPETKIDGQRVVWRDQGSGPAVILLHCSSSHSGQWKPLIEALKGDFRCLAPDLHGYGQSALYPTGQRPCWAHDIEIVRHLLKEAGGEAHLVGHSLGGAVAVRAALAFSDKVRSLTLFEPVLFGLLEILNDPSRLEYLQVAHDVLVMMHFDEAQGAARLFTDFWMGDGAFASMDPSTQAYVTSVMPRVAEDWLGTSYAAPTPLSPDTLRDLTMPCHLVRSEKIHVSVNRIMEIVETALPEAVRTTIAGAGHMGPVTHPGKVNPRIEAFLRAQV